MTELNRLNENRLREDIAHGESASKLLNSPYFKECMTIIEADLIAKWSKTKHDESEEREELYRDSKALNRIKTYLEALVNSAKMATQTIDAKKMAKDQTNRG